MDNRLLITFLTIVPLLGVVAQWIAWRLRLPSILLLLGFGVALGRFINVDEVLGAAAGSGDAGPTLLFPLVSLSVAIILFDGGLTLRLNELRQAGRGILRLVTLGAAISWILGAAFARLLLGFDLRIAALLGAILVVTGPTVVTPILRSIRPKRRVGSLVKWEGIVIDPIGAILAVLVFELAFAEPSAAPLRASAWLLGRTILVGGGCAAIAAWILVQILKRYWMPDYLHGVLFLAAALSAFTLSNQLQSEAGLVTVTVLGILLANQKRVSIRHVAEFKEQLSVFLISSLFIVLGSRLQPARLLELGWGGPLFIAALILLVRPASVYLSLLGSDLRWNERTFLAFLAPRGIVAAAVSSIFALELATHLAGHESVELVDQARRLVPATFLVILSTVTVYGLLAAPLARWLELADPRPQGVLFAGAGSWVREIAALLRKSGFQVMLVDTNYSHIAQARMDDLPAQCVSILSEQVQEEMDLGGIGRLLALTPSDEVNTLAVRELAHVFGREHVYQLKSSDAGSRRQSLSDHLQGRLAFQPAASYAELAARFSQGWILKRTKLTQEFSFEQFVRRYGESATLLFVISDGGGLTVCAGETRARPQTGQTLIALVKEGEPEA